MKVLVDECLPKPLIRALRGHNFRTAQQMGWAGVENGALLKKADALFHVFLTSDQNIRYQQNLRDRLLAIVVLPTNHWPTIRKQVPAVQKAIDSATPGTFTDVEFED